MSSPSMAEASVGEPIKSKLTRTHTTGIPIPFTVSFSDAASLRWMRRDSEVRGHAEVTARVRESVDDNLLAIHVKTSKERHGPKNDSAPDPADKLDLSLSSLRTQPR